MEKPRGFRCKNKQKTMKTKAEIVENWLPRYTRHPLEDFGKHVLLTNFNNYVDRPARAGLRGEHADGHGGGHHHHQLRDGKPQRGHHHGSVERREAESLPLSGQVRRHLGQDEAGRPDSPLGRHPGRGHVERLLSARSAGLAGFHAATRRDYWTGTVYTTNRRIWEHDERFKDYLRETRAMAVDMETATLFTCGFANHIPTGALLLVSDNPMTPEGVKTAESDKAVTHDYAPSHVAIGIDALRLIIGERQTVKHLKYDW